VNVSRRVSTLSTGLVLLVVLVLLAAVLKVPYVVLGPGPTFNTLGKDDQGNTIIMIDGHDSNTTSGNLNLTTVSVSVDDITIFQAIRGWWEHDQVVVPRDTVYPPGQSTEQTNQQNTADFVQSQDSAETAALCELGYPSGIGITSIDDSSKAKGLLDVGDLLVSIAGAPVTDAASVQKILSTATPGSSVPVVVSRMGAQSTEDVTLIDPASGSSGARIGITVASGCFAPFSIDLGLASEIGGPSAGLMFALGIIDKLGNQNLTGGKFIAGTGTIDASGNVGPIGGIQLKMIAARRAGATVFLAPADNCSDVRGATPKGLKVIKVSTLQDALTDLTDIQQGKSVPSC
jgi:PDZ domain-containing protein